MTWEAVRRDLLSNEAALRERRGALRDIGCVLASEASAKLSDLRFLDMLAWAAKSGDAGRTTTSAELPDNVDSSPPSSSKSHRQ
jgi:hypothetical protein